MCGSYSRRPDGGGALIPCLPSPTAADHVAARRNKNFVLPSCMWKKSPITKQSDQTMRRNPRLFRLTASVALGALLWDMAWPLAAAAQPPPPPLPPAQGQPDQNQADPPARVGRILRITGAVSFHNQGDTQWSTASVNYPVSAGNAFWTEPSAETQLEISDSRIALAGGSEFDVYTLDASG